MSKLLTPVDAYEFANAWQEQAIGKKATIQATDATSLMSVGEAIFQSGMENTINSLYILMGKLWVTSKKYAGKGSIIQAKDTGVYTHRFAKVRAYSKKQAIASGYWNTNVKTNFAPGYDNTANGGASTKSMWEQNPAVTVTFTFGGSNVLDFPAPTMYLDKLEMAFRNESEFRSVINEIMITFENDMAQYRENFNRQQLAAGMAQTILMEQYRPESVIHAVTEFNADNGGTSYTKTELKTLYAREFYTWLASKLDITLARMQERSILFHASFPKTVNGEEYELLDFNKLDDLKIAAFAPDFIKMEKIVLPETFQLAKLEINKEKFEKFTYWQNINEPGKISIKPAIVDADPTSENYMKQIDGTNVTAEPLLYIFSKDRLLTDMQFKRALSSPVEARKGYYNVFHHWAFNFISSPDESDCLVLWD